MIDITKIRLEIDDLKERLISFECLECKSLMDKLADLENRLKSIEKDRT